MKDDVRPSTELALAFGPFRLLPLQRVLLRADTPQRLGSRAREILLALVERAGEVVKKNDLIERVWPDTFVGEGALRVHIASLRKVLGDGEDGMRYVENVTGHGYRFVAQVTRVEARPGAQAQAATHQHHMPISLTPMIGRAQVVHTLAVRLPTRRFVTIVGPGGIGKTTVAMATADRLCPVYTHGIRFVDLGSLTDPGLIAGTVASALGLATASPDPLPNIIDLLQNKSMLIVLDNCEHVIEAAAVLAEKLLMGAPNIHILATSREPLRAESEWVLRLEPLELPPSSAQYTANEALAYPGIQLFVERATASLHSFALQDADVPIVMDICHRLDGLPLAIELAAARMDLFGLRGLAARLDDRLGFLTQGRRTALPRHQTLRATLDWSYELLCALEQTALRRLAVFAGSFDLESARQVIVDERINTADVLDILMRIAAKSLLTVHVAGPQVLYRLLHTSRAYALEKLDASSERTMIKRRHAQWCCDRAKEDVDWEPWRLAEEFDAHDPRIDDARAALDWCFCTEGDAALGVRLTVASARIWFQSSFMNEYRDRLERSLQALATLPAADPALELQLNATLGGTILYTTGPSGDVTAAFGKTLELAAGLDATVHHRRAVWGLYVDRMAAADYLAAVQHAEKFCLMNERAADPATLVAGDRMMALAHHMAGNQATARAHAERALGSMARPIAASSDRAWQFDHRVAAGAILSRILWLQGFPDQAVRAGNESLDSAQSIGHSLSMCYALVCVATVMIWTGDIQEARRLVAILSDHATRHSLDYWRYWACCLEVALSDHPADLRVGRALLWDPLCTSVHQETLATLNEALVTHEAFVRAESGAAGWCAAEILRVKADSLLKTDRANAAAAEALLRQSLQQARHQGALSWQLRSVMSLARLWHCRGQSLEAHDLLSSMYARFTEGLDSADLVAARSLLEAITERRRVARDARAGYFGAATDPR